MHTVFVADKCRKCANIDGKLQKVKACLKTLNEDLQWRVKGLKGEESSGKDSHDNGSRLVAASGSSVHSSSSSGSGGQPKQDLDQLLICLPLDRRFTYRQGFVSRHFLP
jgi:hypothetical protein